jgi:hypothetical protein
LGMEVPPPPPEDILGYFNVFRDAIWSREGSAMETLFFTRNRIIVAQTASGKYSNLGFMGLVGWAVQDHNATKTQKRILAYSAEDILRDNEKNFAIANSEIVRAVLKEKSLGRIHIEIETNHKKYRWYVYMNFPGKEDRHLEDFSGLLQIAAGNKLVIIPK